MTFPQTARTRGHRAHTSVPYFLAVHRRPLRFCKRPTLVPVLLTERSIERLLLYKEKKKERKEAEQKAAFGIRFAAAVMEAAGPQPRAHPARLLPRDHTQYLRGAAELWPASVSMCALSQFTVRFH